jgi:hypothetical protein
MRSSAPVPLSADDDVEPPADWYLHDGFNLPVSVEGDLRGEALRRSFEVRARRDGINASMHVNVALRWDSARRGVGVDPDVMWVEPAIPPGSKSVLTWREGHSPPRVAVEIVSEDNAEKDYNRGPAKYGASGTRELWVFDPDGYGRTKDGRGPWVLQVWRHDKRGRFRRVYMGDGPAYSKELGAWLVVVDDTLRVADDEAGTALWPTTDEARDEAEAKARDADAAREAEAAQAREAEAARDAEATKARDAEANARDAEANARDAEAAREAEAAKAREAEAKVRALEARVRALESARSPGKRR